MIVYAMLPVDPKGEDTSRLVNVQPETSRVGEIAQLMAEAGLVRDADFFYLLLRLTGTGQKLQAGHYRLAPSMNAFEIMEQLRDGRVTPVVVTIPEGFELKQIAARLEERGLADYHRFMELAVEKTLVFGDSPPVDIPVASLEGYLFPDTYYYIRSI